MRTLDRAVFDRLFQFAIDGGYVLRAYDRYKRLMPMPDGRYRIANGLVARRHRQNIGVIVEAARLKVKRVTGAGRGGGFSGRSRNISRKGLRQATPSSSRARSCRSQGFAT